MNQDERCVHGTNQISARCIGGQKHIGKLIFWHPQSTDISLSSAALFPNCEFITSLARCSAAGFVFTPSVRLPADRFSSARWIWTRRYAGRGSWQVCGEKKIWWETLWETTWNHVCLQENSTGQLLHRGGGRLLSRIILETRASSRRQRVFTHRFCYRTKRNKVHSTSIRSRFWFVVLLKDLGKLQAGVVTSIYTMNDWNPVWLVTAGRWCSGRVQICHVSGLRFINLPDWSCVCGSVTLRRRHMRPASMSLSPDPPGERLNTFRRFTVLWKNEFREHFEVEDRSAGNNVRLLFI